MKNLYIVGAGGLGRKLSVCLRRLNEDNRWDIKGFLDDNEDALANTKCDLEVVGSISEYVPQDDDVLVMGISNPKAKHTVSDLLLAKGAKFETVVSPDVILGDYVEIGEGSVVMTPYNVESCVKIGRFVTLLGSTIALDGVIDDYATTAGFANLTCSHIGKEAYVGSHAVVLSNCTVGEGAFVSVGSIVMKDVEPYTQVFGCPARVIGKRD